MKHSRESLSVDWGRVARAGGNIAVVGVIGAALFSAGSCAVKSSRKGAEIERDLADYNQAIVYITAINAGGIDYYLTGPDAIDFREGPVSYSLNFKTGLMAIDGPGNADMISPLDGEKMKAVAETAREAICEVVQLDVEKYPALRFGWKQEELNQKKETAFKNRKLFAEKHCPPPKPALEAQ